MLQSKSNCYIYRRIYTTKKMKQFYKFILVLAVAVFIPNPAKAQVTLLDETLLTQSSFNTFTPISVAGAQVWNFSSQYGAVCSGFSGGQNFANEDWFISPALNLSQLNNAKLTFNHTRGNASVMNVGVSNGWYKAFATANYTGNPATTQWVEITGINQNITTAWQYIPSGELTVPDAARSQNTRIAFRYMSSATQSATWEIKNVKVTGSPQNVAMFKVTNWNTEWLGCATPNFGPNNESQQLSNVATAMLAMNSDIYCIQEITNTAAVPTIQNLVNLLGSNDWGGVVTPIYTEDCDQRQAIIYKKAKVQFVNAVMLSSGNAYQGNSYNYNWSGGRFPAVFNVNLVAGNNLIPVSLVNIHAKAEENNSSATPYTRRLGASVALKTILDGANYNTKNVILIGDFNDYLVGTTNEGCACTNSPYKNFMDDPARYTPVTHTLTDIDTQQGTHPLIENMIVSNELAGNYFANSAAQEITMPQIIGGFYTNTSNHLPVSAMFQFSTLGTQDVPYTSNKITVYPNPVKDELIVDMQDSTDVAAEIYDISGRQVAYKKTGNIFNLSALPAGMYILKIGSKSAKFIKE